MASSRNRSLDEDAFLDVARDCVLAVGVRRASLADVARRSGVSRMSLYRRWPDFHALVTDLMTREWVNLVAASAPDRGDGAVRAWAVEAVVAGVRALRDHPLYRKIVEVDPEMLLPYVLDRRGRSTDGMLAFVADALRAGHRDGSVRDADPELQARAVFLAAQSFVLTGRAMSDGDVPLDALDGELAQLLDRYLAP